MNHDPALQSLFTASEQQYDDEDFTMSVMKKSRFVRYRTRINLALSLLLLVVIVTFLSANVQALIIQINNMLTTDIFDLGKGIGSIIFEPINTIAGVLLIVTKLTHTIVKMTKK